MFIVTQALGRLFSATHWPEQRVLLSWQTLCIVRRDLFTALTRSPAHAPMLKASGKQAGESNPNWVRQTSRKKSPAFECLKYLPPKFQSSLHRAHYKEPIHLSLFILPHMYRTYTHTSGTAHSAKSNLMTAGKYLGRINAAVQDHCELKPAA